MKRRIDIPEAEQIPEFMKILDDLYVGNNVFLVGSAGTGKSTLAEKVAYAHYGRLPNDGKALPFVTINCNKWTSPIDIKGGQTIEGYREGAMIEAWRDGKMLILDEMPKLDPNTAGILNDALAKTADPKAIIFNGLNQPIPKHPGFTCIGSGNTTGKGASAKYRGNNIQDASLIDRFSGSIYHIGFNKTLESYLIYAPLRDICWKVREAILEYEGNEENDDETEDIMTLRTMTNFQRIYELEMLRETGLLNRKGKREPEVRGGKTLKDCIESYFFLMQKDKAAAIREQVDVEAFYNAYRGQPMRDQFKEEYQRRTSN